MNKKRTQVGNPMNFRGFMYQPINEQGVVYLFGLVAKDLNMVVESIQQGYPDCTALRYKGKDRWERVGIEFEFKSSHFDHDINGCDIIVCWVDDLNEMRKKEISGVGIEIIELKSLINTPQIPNEVPKNPEDIEEEEFNLEYHFKKNDVTQSTKDLFKKLDFEIKNINKEIWDKYSKTAITYYSPDKMFISMRILKTVIRIEPFTNNQKVGYIENTPNHENWGRVTIKNEIELNQILPSLKKSYELMKEAEREGINTGWYALTPLDKSPWKLIEEDLDEFRGSPIKTP